MRKMLTLVLLVMNMLSAKWAHSSVVHRHRSTKPHGLRNCEDVYGGPCRLLRNGRRENVVKSHTGIAKKRKQVPIKMYQKKHRIKSSTFNSIINFYSSSVGRDPEVVILMASFGKHESDNNYWAKGLSGEKGRYQFTKECWKTMAPRCAIFVPIERATPQEQDLVMYTQLKEWKDRGWQILEIASMWNAGEGEPNAYTGVFWTNTKTHRAGSPSKGWNRDGAYYDVATYSQNVYSTYLELRSQILPIMVG